MQSFGGPCFRPALSSRLDFLVRDFGRYCCVLARLRPYRGGASEVPSASAVGGGFVPTCSQTLAAMSVTFVAPFSNAGVAGIDQAGRVGSSTHAALHSAHALPWPPKTSAQSKLWRGILLSLLLLATIITIVVNTIII